MHFNVLVNPVSTTSAADVLTRRHVPQLFTFGENVQTLIATNSLPPKAPRGFPYDRFRHYQRINDKITLLR